MLKAVCSDVCTRCIKLRKTRLRASGSQCNSSGLLCVTLSLLNGHFTCKYAIWEKQRYAIEIAAYLFSFLFSISTSLFIMSQDIPTFKKPERLICLSSGIQVTAL